MEIVTSDVFTLIQSEARSKQGVFSVELEVSICIQFWLPKQEKIGKALLFSFICFNLLIFLTVSTILPHTFYTSQKCTQHIQI